MRDRWQDGGSESLNAPRGAKIQRQFAQESINGFLKNPIGFIAEEVRLADFNVLARANSVRLMWATNDFDVKGFMAGMTIAQRAYGLQAQFNEEPQIEIDTDVASVTSPMMQVFYHGSVPEKSDGDGGYRNYLSSQPDLSAILEPYLDVDNPNVKSLTKNQAESIWQGAGHFIYMANTASQMTAHKSRL